MKRLHLTPGNLPWLKATAAQWRYALRNTIAMCPALTFAYYLNLDEPYWAMTSAAVVSFPTVGGVISKSLGRVAGSLLGATAALIIAGHTLNEPWLFLLSMSARIGLCTGLRALYQQRGLRVSTGRLHRGYYCVSDGQHH